MIKISDGCAVDPNEVTHCFVETIPHIAKYFQKTQIDAVRLHVFLRTGYSFQQTINPNTQEQFDAALAKMQSRVDIITKETVSQTQLKDK